MLINNRRPYMGRPMPERTQDGMSQSIPQNVDADSLKRLLVESLKQLNKSVEDLDKRIRVLEDKIDYLDTRLIKTEDKMNKYDSRYSATSSDLTCIRSELDSLRKNQEFANTYYYDDAADSTPIMPGTGFACITPEYLRSLAKR